MDELWKALRELFKFLSAIFVTPRDQIRKVVAIFDAMHRIVQETKVQRLLVLKAHNGGGVIKPSGDLYISTVYEDYRSPFESIKADYQRIEADKHYAKMLLELIQNKKIRYTTDRMPSGLLKNVYTNLCITHSVIYYIGQDKKNIYFASCATSTDGLWMTSAEETEVDVLINIIKQNIK